MERRSLLWACAAVLAVAAIAFFVWALGFAGCRPDCPTERLYIDYHGTTEEPQAFGHGYDHVDRAELDRNVPGLVPLLERSQTERLVEVKDDDLDQAVRSYFVLGVRAPAHIEVDGHLYFISIELLGDK